MKTIVIDANIGISFIFPLPYSHQSLEQMNRWRTDKVRIMVPALWRYEILSSLRKAIASRLISFDSALDAYHVLQDMAFEERSLAPGSAAAILQWAERVGQIVAYDAVYLALCEQEGAEFWTADRRLAEVTHRAGVDWVYLVGAA
jgi:predicted nucleic acid-binding protein